MVSTTIEFELMNDEKVSATLNFGKLYLLQVKNKAEYENYVKAIKTKEEDMDEFVLIRVIYTAYVCANIDDHMSFIDFLNVCPVNKQELRDIYNKLQPKKN